MALLDDIEAFLEHHEDLSATALGDRALGDRHFVRQLRMGRRVWPETEDKIRAFMADHEASNSGDGAAVSTGQADEESGEFRTHGAESAVDDELVETAREKAA